MPRTAKPKAPKGAKVVAGLLEPQMVPIDQLREDPRNARKHSKRNVDVLRKNLRKFGQHRLAVVQRQGMIVRVGNGMLQAAREEGWTELACVIVDENDQEAMQRAIADNRIAELAEWDLPVLAEQLGELAALDADLDSLGWAKHEADPLLAAVWNPPETGEGGEQKAKKNQRQDVDALEHFTAEEKATLTEAITRARVTNGDENLSVGACLAIAARVYLNATAAAK